MFVSTRTPCRVAVPIVTPARLETVAKWKVVKKKVKLRPRKSNPSDKRHVGCTSYPEMPPPPPQFTILKEAGSDSVETMA
ncbi:g3884 [Coccomyxa elongata]